MIERGIEQLRVEPVHIADHRVEGPPVVAVEQEPLLDEERLEGGSGGAGPVVVGGQNGDGSP